MADTNEAGNPSTGEGVGGGEGQQEGERKVVEEKGDHLNLKVKSQDGNEVYFKVKKTTQFSKVMAAYCKKVGADQDSVRFLFDGQRVQPASTPEEVCIMRRFVCVWMHVYVRVEMGHVSMRMARERERRCVVRCSRAKVYMCGPFKEVAYAMVYRLANISYNYCMG